MVELTLEQKLADSLVKGGFVTQEQLEKAEKIAKDEKKTLEEVILEKGFLSNVNLGRLIANLQNWQFINLAEEKIDPQIVRLIPEEFAKEHKVLAFGKKTKGIQIAMNNPSDKALIEELVKILNVPLLTFYATARDISNNFKAYQSDMTTAIQEIFQGQDQENAIIRVVDLLITRAYESNASDIHIEPQNDHLIVRFRIDGVMHDVLKMDSKYHDPVIARIKVMSHLRTDEHQAPQDGKLQFKMSDDTLDVRISILPTTKGENAVMRLLSERAKQFSVTELGLSENNLNKILDLVNKPWGTILVTGPTGSGKTTTLYCLLKIINKREVNIATIEDPVEYEIEGVTQIQVNEKTDLTFATGLKSIVRQDPDVIMIGEIRDKETAEIAINSAMTGHLVLSTLHTNDAPTAIPRILDMDVEPFLVASTINIVIAQRLVRKICTRCVESYETDLKELSHKIPVSLLEKLAGGKDKVTLYQGTGCDVCNHTGYQGRTGVFEIMTIDKDIKKMIMEQANSDSIKKKAIESGMATMFDDARDKVLNGVTTIEEMLRVIQK